MSSDSFLSFLHSLTTDSARSSKKNNAKAITSRQQQEAGIIKQHHNLSSCINEDTEDTNQLQTSAYVV